MRLASRGLRDLGEGEEVVRDSAARVMLRRAASRIAVTTTIAAGITTLLFWGLLRIT